MAICSSLSAQSGEVRFCNSDCSEYFSLFFGDKSVWGYPRINGVGTTLPIISRTSETTWTISFPPRTAGRLWNRTTGIDRKIQTSEDETDLGLYYYEGSLEIQKQRSHIMLSFILASNDPALDHEPLLRILQPAQQIKTFSR